MIEKHDFKNFKGTIWVESYDDHIEPERCDIYDEYQNYIDYINVENMTKEEYDEYLDMMLSSKDIEHFIQIFCNPYFYCSTDRLELMYNIHSEERQDEDHDTYSKAIMDEIRNDDETLGEVEFCDKYLINKIGKYYFYMGD